MSTPEFESPEAQDRGRLARMPRVVPVLVLAIALAHAVTYLLDAAAYAALIDTFAVVPSHFAGGGLDVSGALAALFGNVFLHAGLIHLFFNAMLILQTGEGVAERFGRDIGGVVRFLTLFFAAGAAGAATYIALNWGSQIPAVGASGAACGLFAAYMLAPYPDWREALRARPVLQMGLVFLLVNVALAALARFTGVLPIAWEAHLGGFFAGLALYPLLLRRRAT